MAKTTVVMAGSTWRQCGCYVATCPCGWSFHGSYSETDTQRDLHYREVHGDD